MAALRCWRGSKMEVDAMLARLVVVCDVAGMVWWRLVVEWWLSKIKKGKEKRYLKIISPMNHM